MNIKDIYKHPIETAKAAKLESSFLAGSIGIVALGGVCIFEANNTVDSVSSFIGIGLGGLMIASSTYMITDKFKRNEIIQDLDEKFEVIINGSEGRIGVVDGIPVLKLQRLTTIDSQV